MISLKRMYGEGLDSVSRLDRGVGAPDLFHAFVS